MKAKLVVEGHEFDIEILDHKLQELIAPSKKTGYERVNMGETFYSVRADGTVFEPMENHGPAHDLYYGIANYYSSVDVAEDNSRADELMRQLRRFAVEHREKELNFQETVYWIGYDFKSLNDLAVLWNEEGLLAKSYGIIYFDSKKTAQLAIETFRDELIWYFTEYKDSL